MKFRLFRSLADLISPPSSWTDGSTLQVSHGLSREAREEIARLAAQPYCLRCGLSIGPHERHDARDPCGRCPTRHAGVVRMARVGTFSEPLISLVHRLKFARNWEIAHILAPFVLQSMQRASQAGGVQIDALVPVPLHWTRKTKRGFNQTDELVKEISKLSTWPILNVLARQKRTTEQARLDNPTQRMQNMQGAFKATANLRFAGKHVWLLDDVSTSGATLHAAATALRQLPREYRAASINAAVICVTDHQSPAPAVA